MSFLDVVERVAALLERAGIPYMLTGSFAGVYYGSPRSTQDIDIVIAPTPAQLREFLATVPRAEYYVMDKDALEALRRESMFNIVDMKTSWKIDLIICKSRAFSREEFSRRKLQNVQGTSLFVASAEDMILAKLEWAKLGKSQRQIEDAANILKLRADWLDRTYLDKWVGELELAEQWKDALRLAAS